MVIAPILEICEILASRGHVIEFATLEGRQALVHPYPFISAVHIVGRAITPAEDDELYLRYSRWDNTTQHGRRDFIKGKKFFDSFWPETYRGLKHIVNTNRPDFIFADYQVEAAKDIAFEHCIPLANMWPQMPWLLVPQKWIPGEPGTQLRCLTSEHASIFDRLYDQTYLLRYSPHLLDLLWWTKKMRRKAGVKSVPRIQKKPDYLLFVNSFFGLEPPKDLPPLIQAVGPILSNTYPPLDDHLESFLLNKQCVAYVAFGTHVILNADKLNKLIQGFAAALLAGHIDGIIWAIRPTARTQLDTLKEYPYHGLWQHTYGDLLANRHPAWLFLDFAPQRAILDFPQTQIFLTHAGPSSANEALYHGVPMIAMAVYGDQLQNSMRLVAAGVAMSLNKEGFSPVQLCSMIETILQDRQGEFRRNVRRMQRIAHVASRRKHTAADAVEEFLYDWGLRYEFDPNDQPPEGILINAGRGKELSPMHLQTADVRMSWIKANNIDLHLIFLALAAVIVALIVLAVEGAQHWHT